MKDVFQVSRLSGRYSGSQISAMISGFNLLQLAMGLSVLVLGSLFYYFFRSAEHTYFLNFIGVNSHAREPGSPVLSALANSLPTFVHALAFSLMTAALATGTKKGYAVACLAWFVVDVLFELGQGFGEKIAELIPVWFADFPFLENTRDYFLRGQFDYLDLLSIALGAGAAYILLILTQTQKGEAI